MHPRLETVGNRVEQTGRELADEAEELIERLSEWMAQTAPEIADVARSKATDAADHARDWAAALPQRLAAALPVVATVPAKPKKRTIVAAFVAGAGLAYFLDPVSGASRRDRVRQKIRGMFGRSNQP